MNNFSKCYYLLPSLIGLIIYFPILYFSDAWDDDPIVFYTKSFDVMSKAFYQNPPGAHFFPLSFFQNFLIFKLFSSYAYPFGFHFYQLAMHVICCLIATLVLFRITKSKLISILVVLLWTAHPINVESVSRLLMATNQGASSTFLMTSLYFFLKVLESTKKNHRFIFSLLGSFFYLASIATYEQYLLFPIVIFFIYFFISSSQNKFDKKDFFFYWCFPLIFIFLFYVLWRFLACGGGVLYTDDDLIRWSETGSIKDILFRVFWLVPQLLVHYFKLFFWPDYLAESQADWYMVGNSTWSFYSLFCQMLILSLIVAGILLWKKIPLFSIGIIWFFICMLPVIQIFPLFTIIDEHYCYLSSIGILLAMFSLVSYCNNFVPKKLLIIIFIFTFSLLTYRTELYLPSGKDKLTQAIFRAKYSHPWTKSIYMVDAISIANSLNKLNELPIWLTEENLKNENKKWVKKYLITIPDYSYKFGPIQTAYKFNTYGYMLRYLYFNGLGKELNQLINQIIKSRNDAYGFYSISRFLNSVSQSYLAWEFLKEAVRLNPRFNFLYIYGVLPLSLKVNKFQEAETIVLNFVDLKPGLQFPYLITGTFYSQNNKLEEALLYFKQAIDPAKRPASLIYKNLYFLAYELFLEKKMIYEARKTLNIILTMLPEDAKAKNELLVIGK